MCASLADKPLETLITDNGERPISPKIAGATDQHRQAGRQLAFIHAHHLRDMARIARLLDRIEAGDSPPAELANFVLATDMKQNLKAFGSLCGQECQMLTFHHNAEEHHMFPELDAKASEEIRAVVARLREEHEVVHELLDRLAVAATELERESTEPSFQNARAIFHQLHRAIKSHFQYEETELAEAIGYYLEGI